MPKRKNRGDYGGDVLQQSGELWPLDRGRGSLGPPSVLQGFTHIEQYPRPVHGTTTGETPGCGGQRLAKLALDGTAANAPQALTVSSESTRPFLRIACESDSQATEAFLDGLDAAPTVLSKLRTASDTHLATILSLLWFTGVLAPPAQALLPEPCVSQTHLLTTLRTRVRAEVVETGRRPSLLCQAAVYSKRGAAERWPVSGAPDFILAPQQAAGEKPLKVHELYLAGRVAVGLTLSDMQGTTVDGRKMVLAVCIFGVILECAREAERRRYLAAGTPVPADLVSPLLVLALPRDWYTMRCRSAVAATPSSRVYKFTWSDLCGVMYQRSPALTVPKALSHAVCVLD